MCLLSTKLKDEWNRKLVEMHGKQMPLDRFFDKDLLDDPDLRVVIPTLDGGKFVPDYQRIGQIQLSRDIKELIKAIKSLKTELDGDL